ncbi:MAG TPA: permease [Mycobacteriales bacterium]|nr:permease [Mycobacteriales bacterium]
MTVDTIGRSLSEGFFMFWDTLWALIFGFTLSGLVQAFVSRAQLQRVMGDHGPRTIVRTSLLGAASSSCSYAASALARTLFSRGADFTTSMVFMVASTNLVVELGVVLWLLLGWQFAVAEFVGGSIMIVLLALIGPRVFRGSYVAAARRRATAATAGHAHGGEPTGGSLSARWRSRQNWSDAASFTLADLRMLRRELVIGFVVAGFLAVAVPNSVYRHVFVTGHGGWTALENAVVGPLVAFVSCVCSIGNVPLAAALWSGGVSVAGVVAFVFADLLSAPLVVIYRKLYGGRQALILVGVLWSVMSLAGLATEALFHVSGLLPHARHMQPVRTGFRWNATTYLDIVFLIAFGAVWWLARHRGSAGDDRYATDPVCAMRVEKANPGAVAVSGGVTTYFCSDGCRATYRARTEPRDRAVGRG